MRRAFGVSLPRKKSPGAVTAILAEIVRENGRFPTEPELRMRKRAIADSPHPSVFRDRFGKMDEQRASVCMWAIDNPGWEDVADIVRPLVKSGAVSHLQTGELVVEGFVYLFNSGDYYKVGRSNSVGRRAYEVALQLPERVEMLHSIETDDPEGIEAYWHRRFAARRANGEWFKLAPDDLAAFTRRRYQ